jgi:hypothetical protein
MDTGKIRAEIDLAMTCMGLYRDSLEAYCEVDNTALSHMAHYSREIGDIVGRPLPGELVKRAKDYVEKRKRWHWEVFDDALRTVDAETPIPDECKEVLERQRGNHPPFALASSGMPMEMAVDVLTVHDRLLGVEYDKRRELASEAIQIHGDYISFLESLLPQDGI